MYDFRDHHRDAAVKHAAQWLLEHGVTRVYVGDVADVLSTHWSTEVNAKTHAFWSHGQLTNRLEDTFEVAGLELEEVSETGTSSTCPYCGGDGKDVTRCGDEFRCHECDVDAHSDVVGAALILNENCLGVDVSRWFAPTGRQPEGEDGERSMARPVPRDPGRARDGDTDGEFSVTYLEWDDHEWTPVVSEAVGTLGSFDQRGVNEPANSSGRPSGWVASRGIPRL